MKKYLILIIILFFFNNCYDFKELNKKSNKTNENTFSSITNKQYHLLTNKKEQLLCQWQSNLEKWKSLNISNYYFTLNFIFPTISNIRVKKIIVVSNKISFLQDQINFSNDNNENLTNNYYNLSFKPHLKNRLSNKTEFTIDWFFDEIKERIKETSEIIEPITLAIRITYHPTYYFPIGYGYFLPGNSFRIAFDDDIRINNFNLY